MTLYAFLKIEVVIFLSKGIQYYENGNKKYEGEFKKGVANGKGTIYSMKGPKAIEGSFA